MARGFKRPPVVMASFLAPVLNDAVKADNVSSVAPEQLEAMTSV
jgi:hypothetical protein